MSTFESYDTRPRYAAMTGESPLSERQETELAAEALEIYGDEELEEFVGNVLEGVATGAGESIQPPVARLLGGVLRAIAPVGLPVGSAVNPLLAPGPGTAMGSKLGWMIDRTLELELEGMDREDAALERARRFVGLAATSARLAARAPSAAPRQLVVRAALADALAEHVPDLLEAAAAGALSPYEHLPDPPGGVVGPGKDFTDAQKKKIIEANKNFNGKVKSDDKRWDPYVELVPYNPRMWTIDHIIPKKLGGTNSYSNARVISSALNSLLREKTFAQRRQTITSLKGWPKPDHPPLPRKKYPSQGWKGHRMDRPLQLDLPLKLKAAPKGQKGNLRRTKGKGKAAPSAAAALAEREIWSRQWSA